MVFKSAAYALLEFTSFFRPALWPTLSMIREKIGFGRSRMSHRTPCTDFYHGEEAKRWESGLTMKENFRILGAQSLAVSQGDFECAELRSPLAIETLNRKKKMFPLASLGSGLVFLQRAAKTNFAVMNHHSRASNSGLNPAPRSPGGRA